MNNRNRAPSLVSFWCRPDDYMRELQKTRKGHGVAVVIAALFGLVQMGRLLFASSSVTAIWIVFGAGAGILGLYFFGWLMRNFGRWFGAEAQQREVRIALGLGILPWTLLFSATYLILSLGVNPELILKYSLIFLGVWLYGFCILLLSLSAALKLSVIKTFLCLAVTVLFSLFPLTLLAQLLAGWLNSFI